MRTIQSEAKRVVKQYGLGESAPLEPDDNLIVIPLQKNCALVLTPQEYLAGLRRGKWWTRRATQLQRETVRTADADVRE